ncbi:hypothetical protein AVEN_107808-1 [Araneus ventricosus]|uniref:Uncharacterized protein n=1 Tax=Araneus ventricosus TaxID=182803 RepID=A0A4Y2Q4V6_ARAVE|nr:hypothetical protein AVEN_192464-1 [Araneus ventricosus]GBN57930.1 hypothetical protein AVEN_107808-1 [Araneus ventricosus]
MRGFLFRLRYSARKLFLSAASKSACTNLVRYLFSPEKAGDVSGCVGLAAFLCAAPSVCLTLPEVYFQYSLDSSGLEALPGFRMQSSLFIFIAGKKLQSDLFYVERNEFENILKQLTYNLKPIEQAFLNYANFSKMASQKQTGLFLPFVFKSNLG